MNQPDYGGQSDSAYRRSMGAIILIAIGALLFLENLGFIPNIRPYWPLALSAFGVAMLSRSQRCCNMVWPWAMIILGVLLTLGNLHVIRASRGLIWPVVLIAAGVSMLIKRTTYAVPRSSRTVGSGASGAFLGNRLHENAVFSSVNRRIDSPNFEGADLNSTFGELKIDLRGATIAPPGREAIIETNASFGAIKIRVPETWKVIVQGSAVFGAFEDKTVPPRPGPGFDPPTLIIRGNASFGAVEIEN